MEIKYQLFENENLYIQKFIGDFSIEHYIKYTRQVLSGIATKPIKKVLIDFRDLIFDETSDDPHEKVESISKIRREFNEKELKNKEVKLVIWVNQPLPTAIVHLFLSNFPNKDYNYCSTEINVIGILNLPKHYSNLEQVISNLENKF